MTEYELRLLERKSAVRYALIRKIIKWLSICTLITVVVWGLVFSPLFKVKDIQLKGTDNLSYPLFINYDELNSYFSSLKSDDAVSMVILSTNTIETTINAIHGIKTSQAVKIWPNTLVVQIEPTAPVAKVGSQLVDIDGQMLGSAMDGMPSYPELNCTQVAYTDCLQLLSAVRDESVFSSGIQSISATGRDDISMMRGDGYTIIFGNTNRLTLKLEVLKQIFAQDIGYRHTVDVSSPVNPVAW